jgi:hypothetical protein
MGTKKKTISSPLAPAPESKDLVHGTIILTTLL